MTTDFFKSKYAIALSILVTGLCYYWGNGLIGDYWYLVWLAPIPVLCLATVNSGKVAFWASFTAYLIGRLSWFLYLIRVATLVPAIIYTIVLALIFAGIILLTRSVAIKLNSWYSVFAFPAFFTVFEYLIIKASPDGTATSIAYSQMNCLPLIQIASVAGILGVTFIVTLMPSAFAFAWYFRGQKRNFMYLSIFSGAMIGGVLLFGFLRLADALPTHKIKVALVVMDEQKHNTSDRPDSIKDKAVTNFYLKQINALAGDGVRAILLPERALSIDSSSAIQMLDVLSAAALKNNVYLVAAYTNLRGKKEHNSAVVFNNKGNIVTEYNKVHLVNGLERQFTPGNTIGLFKLDKLQSGVAICKDLDFQEYIRHYGESKPCILFIPAWDFIVDDWLHSRMAILRGVENGFSEVRAARTGRLTISDLYGRVTYEASTSNQQKASLIGYVSTQQTDTLYTVFGDWLGIVSFLISVVFMFKMLVYKRSGVVANSN